MAKVGIVGNELHTCQNRAVRTHCHETHGQWLLSRNIPQQPPPRFTHRFMNHTNQNVDQAPLA